MTRQGVTGQVDRLGGADPDPFTQDQLSICLVLCPPGYFIVHAPIALPLRIWGKGTPATVRLGLYFAALTIAIPWFSASVCDGVLAAVPLG